MTDKPSRPLTTKQRRGVVPLAGQRQKRETSRNVQACNDYLRLGPGRSLRILWERYTKDTKNLPPSSNFYTLKGWSGKHGWVARAELYDAEMEQAKNERRKEIMESGLALDYERVDSLKELASFLIGEIEKTVVAEKGDDDEGAEKGNGERFRVWLPDVKQIGSGENAKRVDIERYNSAIFSDLRGILDDLAKETGGRIAQHDIKSDGKALFDPETWKAKRLERLSAVEELDDESQDG